MTEQLIAGSTAVDDASELLVDFGLKAAAEAAARADRSRNLGNIIHFCHWRQVGRLVGLLARTEAEGTVH